MGESAGSCMRCIAKGEGEDEEKGQEDEEKGHEEDG